MRMDSADVRRLNVEEYFNQRIEDINAAALRSHGRLVTANEASFLRRQLPQAFHAALMAAKAEEEAKAREAGDEKRLAKLEALEVPDPARADTLVWAVGPGSPSLTGRMRWNRVFAQACGEILREREEAVGISRNHFIGFNAFVMKRCEELGAPNPQARARFCESANRANLRVSAVEPLRSRQLLATQAVRDAAWRIVDAEMCRTSPHREAWASSYSDEDGQERDRFARAMGAAFADAVRQLEEGRLGGPDGEPFVADERAHLAAELAAGGLFSDPDAEIARQDGVRVFGDGDGVVGDGDHRPGAASPDGGRALPVRPRAMVRLCATDPRYSRLSGTLKAGAGHVVMLAGSYAYGPDTIDPVPYLLWKGKAGDGALDPGVDGLGPAWVRVFGSEEDAREALSHVLAAGRPGTEEDLCRAATQQERGKEHGRRQGERYAFQLATVADASCLALLRRHLTLAELERCTAALAAADEKAPEHLRLPRNPSREAWKRAKQAEALLAKLDEEGYSYSVEADRGEGNDDKLRVTVPDLNVRMVLLALPSAVGKLGYAQDMALTQSSMVTVSGFYREDRDRALWRDKPLEVEGSMAANLAFMAGESVESFSGTATVDPSEPVARVSVTAERRWNPSTGRKEATGGTSVFPNTDAPTHATRDREAGTGRMSRVWANVELSDDTAPDGSGFKGQGQLLFSVELDDPDSLARYTRDEEGRAKAARDLARGCVAARNGLAARVDVEGIVEAWMGSANGTVTAAPTGDEEVDAVRSAVACYLSDFQEQTLLRPGADPKEFRRALRGPAGEGEAPSLMEVRRAMAADGLEGQFESLVALWRQARSEGRGVDLAAEAVRMEGMDPDMAQASGLGLQGALERLDSLSYVGDGLAPEDVARRHVADWVLQRVGGIAGDEDDAPLRDEEGRLAPLVGDGPLFDPAAVAAYASAERRDGDGGPGKPLLGGDWRERSERIVDACRVLGVGPEDLMASEREAESLAERTLAFDEASARPMGEVPDEEGGEFLRARLDTVMGALSQAGVVARREDVLIDRMGVVRWTGAYAARARSRQKSDSELVAGTFLKEVERDGRKVRVPRGAEALVKGAGLDKEGVHRRVSGTIGQIFAPDAMGVVTQVSASGEAEAFIPSWRGYVVPDDGRSGADGGPKGFVERCRFVSFAAGMDRAIRHSIARDAQRAAVTCAQPRPGEVVVEDPVGLNREAYGGELRKQRVPVNYMEHFRQVGLSDDEAAALVKKELGRVLFDEEVGESNAHEDARARAAGGAQASNDRFKDPRGLTGCRNMGTITEETDGLFDPMATKQTSKNQNRVRYFCDGVEVDDATHVATPAPADSRDPLLQTGLFRHAEFDPYDRSNMGLAAVAKAKKVLKRVRVAQVTANGWNYEDAVVANKAYADRVTITETAEDGSTYERALKEHDKVTCLHGNKGLIGLAVDEGADASVEAGRLGHPDAAEGYAELQGLLKANRGEPSDQWPEGEPLAFLFGPFSLVGRKTGGLVREMMEDPEPLLDADGNVIGTVGHITVVVTDDTADKKNTVYSREDVARGRGRKIGPQYSHALVVKGCDGLMRELFGRNEEGLARMRSHELLFGRDIDQRGRFADGYRWREADSAMSLAEVPPVDVVCGRAKGAREWNKDWADMSSASAAKRLKRLRARWKDEASRIVDAVADEGGWIALPEGLEVALGQGGECPALMRGEHGEWAVTDPYVAGRMADGEPPSPAMEALFASESARLAGMGRAGAALPVLPRSLRQGSETRDGELVRHEHTRRYATVLAKLMERAYFQEMARLGQEAGEADGARACLRKAERAEKACQRTVNQLCEQVWERCYSDKHCDARAHVMTCRAPVSATMTVTGSAYVHPQEVWVSEAEAAKMVRENGEHVKDGDWACVGRDPVQDGQGVLGAVVRVAPGDWKGLRVNNGILQIMGADCDGDTLSLVVPQTEGGVRDASEKLAVWNNMLDEGKRDPETGERPLVFNRSTEIRAALKARPALAEEWARVQTEANAEHEAAEREGRPRSGDVLKGLLDRVATVMREGQGHTCGQVANDFSGPGALRASLVEGTVEKGGKGSEAAVDDLFEFSGIERTEAGGWALRGHTLKTREEKAQSLTATGVKNDFTGKGAMPFQYAIMLGLDNGRLGNMSKVSKVVYQAPLDQKHHAPQALHVSEVLFESVGKCYRGGVCQEVAEPVLDGDGNQVTGDDGLPVTRPKLVMAREPGRWVGEKVTPEQAKGEWVQSIRTLMCSEAGLGFPEDAVDIAMIESWAEAPGFYDEGDRRFNDPTKAGAHGSTLAQMAYLGAEPAPDGSASQKELAHMSAAMGGEGLFDGEGSRHYAPDSVRAAKAREDGDMELAASIEKAKGQPRPQNRPGRGAASVPWEMAHLFCDFSKAGSGGELYGPNRSEEAAQGPAAQAAAADRGEAWAGIAGKGHAGAAEWDDPEDILF